MDDFCILLTSIPLFLQSSIFIQLYVYNGTYFIHIQNENKFYNV